MSDKRLWDRPEDLDRISLALLALGVALAVYGALYWLVHRPVFAISRVEVAERPAHVTARQVEDVVRRELRGNFFTLDLEASRRAFARLPWVREAALERRWPGTLEVRIVEQQAVAVWRDGGLVNRDGDVFQGATDADLPVFGGPDGSSRLVAERYAAVRAALAEVGLTPHAIELSPRHAWSIELQGGPRIEVGRSNDLAPLQRFLTAYRGHIEPVMPHLSHIDLRYRNGFVLRARDGKPIPLPGRAPTGAAVTRKT
jgi:cell division protein FtsQ